MRVLGIQILHICNDQLPGTSEGERMEGIPGEEGRISRQAKPDMDVFGYTQLSFKWSIRAHW